MQDKIKILFICGSLEQGRDGVGDYVRKLGLELICQGHEVKALAINDPFITEVHQPNEINTESIPVFRIPSNLPQIERVGFAKSFTDKYQPDWVSLQYVIFAFHDKGLPFNFSKHLATLGKNIKWHIMFHELYVGMNRGSSRRHRLWGLAQRSMIKKLVRTLRPKAVSTQNSVYQTILRQDGIQSFHLPLFGNIRHSTAVTDKHKISGKPSRITVVIFGTIHPDSLVDQFAKEASEFSLAHALDIHLIVIGRSGIHQDELVRVWKSYSLTAEVPGEQSEEIISQTLSSATFGISTTMLAMIEKSGTVAAMTEHYLPVLCIAKRWERRGIENIKAPPGIFQYRKGELKSFIDGLESVEFKPQNVTEISLELIRNLIRTA